MIWTSCWIETQRRSKSSIRMSRSSVWVITSMISLILWTSWCSKRNRRASIDVWKRIVSRWMSSCTHSRLKKSTSSLKSSLVDEMTASNTVARPPQKAIHSTKIINNVWNRTKKSSKRPSNRSKNGRRKACSILWKIYTDNRRKNRKNKTQIKFK